MNSSRFDSKDESLITSTLCLPRLVVLNESLSLFNTFDTERNFKAGTKWKRVEHHWRRIEVMSLDSQSSEKFFRAGYKYHG